MACCKDTPWTRRPAVKVRGFADGVAAGQANGDADTGTGTGTRARGLTSNMIKLQATVTSHKLQYAG